MLVSAQGKSRLMYYGEQRALCTMGTSELCSLGREWGRTLFLVAERVECAPSIVCQLAMQLLYGVAFRV